ncbi:SET domain-containing protein-lysine N-methyltransferase [bacterium]|nr:SET domain-containing protein-lysine N-methyltransferase [bacterium]
MMYKVEKDEIKGRKIVATKFIPKNTIIIKEKPFIVGEDAYDILYYLFTSDDEELMDKYEELTPHKMDKYIIEYEQILDDIKHLPDYMQEIFLYIKPEKLRLLVAKFYRNAFTYNCPQPSAMLSEGTLLNHSCDNNVDFYVDNNGYFIFKTNRDVNEGDELCDSYLYNNTSKKKRKSDLLYQYGFECQCNKCLIIK